jgi:hypothetical protein
MLNSTRVFIRASNVKTKTIFTFLVLGVLILAVPAARSQQNAQAPDRRHFDADDRQSMHAWYALHHDELPLGLRRKDRLPSDLEKQLVVHEVLSDDLRARIHTVSGDFLGRVPPAPEGCQYVFIGGHAVLLDAKTYYVYDVFHFEQKQ